MSTALIGGYDAVRDPDFARLHGQGARFRTSGVLWLPDPVGGWKSWLTRLFVWPRRQRLYAVRDGLNLTSDWGRKRNTVRENRKVARDWNRLMRDRAGQIVNPSEITELARRDLPKPSALCLGFVGRAVHATLIVHDGEVPLASARCVLWPERRSAWLETIRRLQYPGEMSPQNPGTARDDLPVGQPIIRNLVRVLMLMGIERLSLFAGWSAGSAVWPKYGFRPRHQWRWLWMRWRISCRQRRLGAREREVTRADVDRTIDSADPNLIFKVSDLSFRNYAALDAKALQAAYPHDLNGYLLQRLRWSGTLDLTEPRARERLERYLERKGFPL